MLVKHYAMLVKHWLIKVLDILRIIAHVLDIMGLDIFGIRDSENGILLVRLLQFHLLLFHLLNVSSQNVIFIYRPTYATWMQNND